jgi:uncharacterized protein
MIGLLTLHLHIPGCTSLKEKRSRLKPLMARLHKEFNLSVAEMEFQDKWRECLLACVMVGNNHVHLEQSLQSVGRWVEENWPDMQLIDDKIKLI